MARQKAHKIFCLSTLEQGGTELSSIFLIQVKVFSFDFIWYFFKNMDNLSSFTESSFGFKNMDNLSSFTESSFGFTKILHAYLSTLVKAPSSIDSLNPRPLKTIFVVLFFLPVLVVAVYFFLERKQCNLDL